MDEPENHRSGKTYTNTEKSNTTCSHSQVGAEQREHMDSGRGASHTLGAVGVGREETVRGGELERDSMGRNARYR